jgi:hypothetical protein
MNDNELAQIPTVDRFERDLNDWEVILDCIRTDINMGESTGNPGFFVTARKRIADVLGEIEQARHFIAVKRAMAEQVTADAGTWFDGDRLATRLDALREDQRLPGEGTAE